MTKDTAPGDAVPVWAPTRQMTVIAQDPGVRRGKQIVMATIDVPAEELSRGPSATGCSVVDFDSTVRRLQREPTSSRPA